MKSIWSVRSRLSSSRHFGRNEKKCVNGKWMRSFSAFANEKHGIQKKEFSSCEPALKTANVHIATPSYGVNPIQKDRFGRVHDYLRLSLTDQCNFRCQYCMPADGIPEHLLAPKDKILTSDDILRILRYFVHNFGIRKLRLTGGEPLVRRDFSQILSVIAKVCVRDFVPLRSGDEVSLGITTNGLLLDRYMDQLVDANVVNLNVSFDTLVPAKFSMISRRPEKWYTKTRKAVDRAIESGDFKVKLNCVLIRGVNDDEIFDFVNLTRDRPIEVRFIEFMPFQQNSWSFDRLVGKAELKLRLFDHFGGLERVEVASSSTAELFRIPGFIGTVGIISSMTDQFCGGCNRIRITADGQLKNCLFGEDEFDLREIARQAGGQTHIDQSNRLNDADLDELFDQRVNECLIAKNAALGGKNSMFQLRDQDGQNRPMVSLGG